MINGILNIYKEKGYTSHDVVARLRGIVGQKKIGHTGTLDPEAEGVLPVCLGRATKVCDMLTDKDKTYETVLLLGLQQIHRISPAESCPLVLWMIPNCRKERSRKRKQNHVSAVLSASMIRFLRCIQLSRSAGRSFMNLPGKVRQSRERAGKS